MASLTFPFLISHPLEALYLHPKICGSIWALFLIESFPFINTLITTPTKLYLWSSTWNSLEIHHVALSWLKNAYSIDVAFFPLHYMAFNYNSTTTLLCHTHWNFWEKCKEEPLYGYLELSRCLLWKVLKWLQALSLSSFTFKNL